MEEHREITLMLLAVDSWHIYYWTFDNHLQREHLKFAKKKELRQK